MVFDKKSMPIVAYDSHRARVENTTAEDRQGKTTVLATPAVGPDKQALASQ
jgi:hypothetical protein